MIRFYQINGVVPVTFQLRIFIVFVFFVADKSLTFNRSRVYLLVTKLSYRCYILLLLWYNRVTENFSAFSGILYKDLQHMTALFVCNVSESNRSEFSWHLLSEQTVFYLSVVTFTMKSITTFQARNMLTFKNTIECLFHQFKYQLF